MYLFISLFLLLLDVRGGYGVQYFYRMRYYENVQSGLMHRRLFNLTRTAYHDMAERVSRNDHLRFLYEQSPNYEQGYVFSEIMDRYQRMVEKYKYMTVFKRLAHTFDFLNQVENIQKLYLEISHFTDMMHEIPNKYKGVPEFKHAIVDAEAIEQEERTLLAYKVAEQNRKEIVNSMMRQEDYPKQKMRERKLKAKKAKKQKKQDGSKQDGSKQDGSIKDESEEEDDDDPTGMKSIGELSMKKWTNRSASGPKQLGEEFSKRWPWDYGWEPDRMWR